MKKFSFALAMLAVALVFGLALVGCKTEADGPFEGTWAMIFQNAGSTTALSYKFTGSDFTMSRSTDGVVTFTTAGTFTYTNTTITWKLPAPYNDEWTHQYVITGNSLVLTRPEGDDHWAGTFIKQ